MRKRSNLPIKSRGTGAGETTVNKLEITNIDGTRKIIIIAAT
jgi:hypothetical protein